jgi:uncharacterized protein (DUF488 family)
MLSLLGRVKRPLLRTSFVKLAFLLRRETEISEKVSFYEFVPYKYGPFSFVLYHELRRLVDRGHVVDDPDAIMLSPAGRELAWNSREAQKDPVARGISYVAHRYGSEDRTALLKYVYDRYPWYATRSELTELLPEPAPEPPTASPAIYTAGYEGRSVDAFFNMLLKTGIRSVVDVRRNPISRKHGFSRRRFAEIARDLGVSYRHVPALGVPSDLRQKLAGADSYQKLFDHYDSRILPRAAQQMVELRDLFLETPSVLVCMEKSPRKCHRSRVAAALSEAAELPVKHL